ncbi:hypothetical protein SNEBB_007961 [Seison nebaliae]|nr:hypothetical protein SNEBB_007961 [Seison nebaliae]
MLLSVKMNATKQGFSETFIGECFLNGKRRTPMTYYDLDIATFLGNISGRNLKGLLGMVKENDKLIWLDKYRTKVEYSCELWGPNEPNGSDAYKYVLHFDYGWKDVGLLGWGYYCTVIKWKKRTFYLSLPTASNIPHKTLKMLVLNSQDVDPKIMMDKSNCYDRNLSMYGMDVVLH